MAGCRAGGAPNAANVRKAPFRPIGRRLLAAYLTWHLRTALAPLTCTDEQPPRQPSPVAPARRSAHAAAKAAAHASADGQILHSFRGLLDHRATITIGGTSFEKISEPTPAQRRAFDLDQGTDPADPRRSVDRTQARRPGETTARERIGLPQATKLRPSPQAALAIAPAAAASAGLGGGERVVRVDVVGPSLGQRAIA